MTTIRLKARVGRFGVASQKFANGLAIMSRSAQFSASCAAMNKTKTNPSNFGRGARAPRVVVSLVNDLRSSAASSSAAAGDASAGGASAALLNQEDMLALRLQQRLQNA